MCICTLYLYIVYYCKSYGPLSCHSVMSLLYWPSQGSHSFTDKKSRIFLGPPWKIFQDFFAAHECLNITYWHHRFKSRRLQIISKQSVQKKMIFIWACEKMHNFEGYFSRNFQVMEFSRKNPVLSRRCGNPAILPGCNTGPAHPPVCSVFLITEESKLTSNF